MWQRPIIELSDISKFRTELMGVATIMILMCHSLVGTYSVQVSGYLRKILAYGNQGVDVFLFLSGVGLWYSLQNGGGRPRT